MKKLLIILVGCLLCVGCASRTIEVDEWGRYHSSLNSEIDDFELVITKPDGTHIEARWGKSVAEPHLTIEAQAELLQQIIPSVIEGILKGLVP
jgi:hypothetical protein